MRLVIITRCLHSILFFDVYVAFRLAVLIEMHRYSSSNLKKLLRVCGARAPCAPMDLTLLKLPKIFGNLASMFY